MTIRLFVKNTDEYVIFGESQVGKTCFLNQVYQTPPDLDYESHYSMNIDGESMECKFMDLSSTTLRAAEPTFQSDIFIMSLSKAVGIVLIYDVTSLESFEHVTEDAYMALWTCKGYMGGGVVGKSCECILVGNKADLVEKDPHKREVSKDLAEQWAQSQGMQHLELTAREHKPVRDAVHDLMRAVRRAKRCALVEEKKKTEPGGRGARTCKKREKKSLRERIRQSLFFTCQHEVHIRSR